MAQYTKTLKEILKNNDIFDIEYDFYSEEHKANFEKKFIDRYYFDEIGFETVGMFKHFLRTRLNEIMPYYKHLYQTTIYEYNPLLNYDVTEVTTRELESEDTNTINNNGGIHEYDTPIQPLSNYKKTPSHISENNSNSTNDTRGRVSEVNKRDMKGNIGVQTTQDLIMKERQVIINIDQQILDELEILFMGVF